MRYGQNPAKLIEEISQPEKITIALVSFIPFLEGYYAESLEVLRRCLESIWENTELPYDLLVFDNASCPEVRAFLTAARDRGRIDFLVLSDKNIGKGGAWNFIFAAAPGEFIAYADSDVNFFPGWLPAQLALFDEFPNLGMVTGAPLRIPQEFSTSTIRWAEENPEVVLERGVLLSWEDWWKHARSLGVETEEEGRKLYAANQDACLVKADKRYFIGAAHYQFVARREVLQSVLPLPTKRPMGQVRALDIAVNELGYLRLSTPEWWVEHMGNSVPKSGSKSIHSGKTPGSQEHRLSPARTWRPLRAALLWLHDWTFDLLYRN